MRDPASGVARSPKNWRATPERHTWACVGGEARHAVQVRSWTTTNLLQIPVREQGTGPREVTVRRLVPLGGERVVAQRLGRAPGIGLCAHHPEARVGRGADAGGARRVRRGIGGGGGGGGGSGGGKEGEEEREERKGEEGAEPHRG